MKKAQADTVSRRSEALRQHAIRKVRTQSSDSEQESKLSRQQSLEIIHELRARQAELSEQNYALRRAHLDLLQSRDYFSRLYDTAPAGMITLDENGCIVEANLAVAEMLGLERARLHGQPLARFFAPGEEDNFHRYRECILSSRERLTTFLKMKRNDGTTCFVGLDGVAASDLENGLQVHLILSETIAGGPPALVAAAQSRQIQVLERERDEMEKLALTGRMAAAIAHEINNPLAGVLYSFLLVKKAIPKDHPNYRFVGLVDKELNRMAGIIRQMYSLYRPDMSEEPRCNACDAMEDVLQILASTIRARQIMVRRIVDHPDGATVRMREQELKQVLYNLVLNALQVSPYSGKVRIHISDAGDHIRIAIHDHGPGIPADKLPHIFEPFYAGFRYADDAAGSGMGLGLALSRSLIEASGGAIEVETQEGHGTTFTVVLPCAHHDRPAA